MQGGTPYSDSPVISELHTYFPALLYDSGRFRNLQDVFRYVQGQLRARYDVFSNSQREFQANDATYQNRVHANTIYTPPNVIYRDITETIGQVAMNDIFTTLLLSSQRQRQAATPPTTSPTREQIRTTTRLLSQSGDSETPCAICQDLVRDGDIVRNLNGCNHVFHVDCIDTWFQRSSLCPTCRHNIIAVSTDAVGTAGDTDTTATTNMSNP